MAVLPHGRACTPGRDVELKVNTKNFFGGWRQLALCTWRACSDQEYVLVLKEAGAVTDFEGRFRVNPNGTCHVLARVRGSIGGRDLNFDIPGLDLQSFNYWVGNLDVVEWDHGKNNNGQGIRIQGGPIAIQMWPKREDRIRLELQMQAEAEATEFEFDTRE